MNARSRLLAALGLALLPLTAAAQDDDTNLVFNPSFEEHTGCPLRIDAPGIMHDVEAWWQPTPGSSDYFHQCGNRECSVPRNKMGMQRARTGDAYCGIYCSQQDYREYLQTELRAPLRPGVTYRVRFYVSLADRSPHAVGAIGALFTPDAVGDTLKGILQHREDTLPGHRLRQTIVTPFQPQVVHPADTPIADPRHWTLVEGVFVAQGGERFLTIGNFADFGRSGVVESHAPSAVLPGAYYYVDDVSVVCIDTAGRPLATPTPPGPYRVVPFAADPTADAPVVEDTLFVVENLYFEVDGSRILPQSYRSLRLLLDHLEAYPDHDALVLGHTDSTGTIAHNQRLSEARAQAVVQYLADHGIDRRRLGWQGLGESCPVADNATADGRRRNRRVEVSFRRR